MSNDCSEVEYINKCLRGEALYGDDFTEENISTWFDNEKEGYYNLTGGNRASYGYSYHQLNRRHGFCHLPDDKIFEHVLGIGSAYGDEFKPILKQCKKITVLEPSEGFKSGYIDGVPLTYQSPDVSGVMPFESDSFDLIVCLGVLHHIPNVSKVVTEIYRCLSPGGYVLFREPVNSMGDWRSSRVGLTKNERGIPSEIFKNIINNAGFSVIRMTHCMFSLTPRLHYVMKTPVYNSFAAVLVDKYISSLPIWAKRYHPRTIWQKLRPTSVFYVLKKDVIC